VFKKIFALALVLVLAAICTRRPLDGKLAERLPNTCAATQFAETIASLDDLRIDQSLALSRVESTSIEEPLDYATILKREGALLGELRGKATGVREPRCLVHAKALFLRYLEESAKALELRAPDKDFTDYRRARESAETIYGQYLAELKLQERNRQ
jgi:hypothetical protein